MGKLANNRWVLGARPRTLPAAIVPVAVGTATVASQEIIWWRALAAMIVAIALQVATNYVNDYADGERGTDDDRVGPVRLVGSRIATSREVKKAAAIAFLIAGLAGGSLVIAVGPELLIVGAASMLAGWAYTGGPRPYGYLGLGEVFVFVFFGLVATIGSAYVHTRTVSALAVIVSVPVGLLAVALLVTNNLRDITGDTAAAKMTLAVKLGDRRTRIAYAALFVMVGVGILAASIYRIWALLALPGLLLAVPPIKQVLAGASGRNLIPVLGQTGRVQLAVGALLTVGLAIGS